MLESHRYNEWSQAGNSLLPGLPVSAPLLFGAVTVSAGGFLYSVPDDAGLHNQQIKKNNARAVRAIILH